MIQINSRIAIKNDEFSKRNTMMYDNLELEVKSLSTEEEVKLYKSTLLKIDKNPFYRYELISSNAKTNNALHYFLLKNNNIPVLIMPFYKRLIPDSITKGPIFYDVISPYGYCGPLKTNETSPEIFQEFWKRVDVWYSENNIVSEFIRFNLDGNHENYSGTLVPSLKNVGGEIYDEETQWNNFRPKVRNNYRKAVQSGLTSRIYHTNFDDKVISLFYEVYIETMIRNKADNSYFYSKEYFENFVFNNRESCCIAIIYKDDVNISSELVLLGEKNVYSFLGGTRSDYFAYRPNDFLKIEVMNWARKNDYKYYLLGGGRKDNDSLYKYKKEFFKKELDKIYYTGRKIINKEIYNQLVDNVALEKEEFFNDINFFPLYRYYESQLFEANPKNEKIE